MEEPAWSKPLPPGEIAMPDKTIPNDFRIEVGRADKGRTFLRVVHVPTGKERILVGLGETDWHEIAFQLAQELANESRAETLGRSPTSVVSQDH